MKYRLNIILLLLISFTYCTNFPLLFKKGEVLKYSVDYGFLHLGTITISNSGYTNYKKRNAYSVHSHILSAPSLMLINIDKQYTVFLNERAEPYLYNSKSVGSKEDYYVVTDFVYTKTNIRIYDYEYTSNHYDNKISVKIKTNLYLSDIHRDNVALFFYARLICGEKYKNLNTKVINDLKSEQCQFFNTGIEKKLKLNNTSFNTYYLDGNLKFVSIAGLKDGFQGWFSADDYGVPLKAYMKAFIGSIRITILTEYP